MCIEKAGGGGEERIIFLKDLFKMQLKKHLKQCGIIITVESSYREIRHAQKAQI